MTSNPLSLTDFGIEDDRGASTISRLMEVKEFIKNLTAEKEALEQALRIELTNNPEPIIDGEHGLVATLKERRAPATIDLVTMATHPEHAAHIVEAARSGLLTASLTPLRAMKGKSAHADALLSYEMPSGASYVLTLERI